MQVFTRWLAAQGGDPQVVEDLSLLPTAPIVTQVQSSKRGYVGAWHTEALGLTSMRLGAGRAQKGDPIDHGVGLVIEKKIGDWVETGDIIAQVYARSQAEAAVAVDEVLAEVELTPTPPPVLPLVIGYII
ncbi:MAG TPA: hypothetical protein DD734_00760 [Firmicutes bacterium]|nr:hypothetical protein [Bacillota bacterium]